MATYRLEFVSVAPQGTRDWFISAPRLPSSVRQWRDGGCFQPLILGEEAVGPVRDWLKRVWYREEYRPVRLVVVDD